MKFIVIIIIIIKSVYIVINVSEEKKERLVTQNLSYEIEYTC